LLSRYGAASLTVMPWLHVTEVPAGRLCQAIRYWGGMSGEKVTVPVKPASTHFSWAFTVFRSTRSMTTHIVLGVEVGSGVGVGGGGGCVGFGVGPGARVGPGPGEGGGGAVVDPGSFEGVALVVSDGEGENDGLDEDTGDGPSVWVAAALGRPLPVPSTTATGEVGLPNSVAAPITTATTTTVAAPSAAAPAAGVAVKPPSA